MTREQMAVRRALSYIEQGMSAKQAIAKACEETLREGMGDFAEGWDTFTTYAPWVGGAIAAYFLWRGAVKVKRHASEYLQKKKRQVQVAKAAWDAAGI